jgi:predicted MFS family arabinose efflux permease
VCIAPVVAGLVREESRTRAFSIFFAASIAVGFVGGLLGGRLHGLFASLDSRLAGLSPLQAAILAGCVLTASALIPAARIRGLRKAPESRTRYPKGPFVRRLLPAVFLWALATGAFNPFYNVYAARYLGLSVTQTGDLFAAGQLAQVAAILAAPLAFRLLGRVRAIAALQAAAAAGLALMALADPLWAPCAAYLLYMSFQWMTEPGLHSLVMSRVEDGERAGASSLMYLTIFAAHAVAAAVAGAAIPVWNYSRVLLAAGGVAVVAAAVFRVGLAPFEHVDGETPGRTSSVPE